MICFLHTLNADLINIIKEYIPSQTFIFTNRENYKMHHLLIKQFIPNYEKYVFNIIRRDNAFVLNAILIENYSCWITIKQVQYKNMKFYNYFYLMLYYCFENGSVYCQNAMNDFVQKHGLNKNAHKKNRVTYIRWKN